MKFLSPQVFLYLYKFNIQPCKKYYCRAWAGSPSYYFDIFDKLQKPVCRTAGPSLTVSLEHLAYCQNIAKESCCYKCYFGRCSSELVWFCFLTSTCYCNMFMIFLSLAVNILMMSMTTVSFLSQLESRITCLGNVFWTYDLSSCNF